MYMVGYFSKCSFLLCTQTLERKDENFWNLLHLFIFGEHYGWGFPWQYKNYFFPGIVWNWPNYYKTSSQDHSPISIFWKCFFIFRLKDGIDFHLFITTSPCGDARIFSLHESSSATNPEPKSKSPEVENEEKDSKEENSKEDDSKEDENPLTEEKEPSDEGVVLDDENNNLEVKEEAKEDEHDAVVVVAKDDSKEELVKEEVKEEEIDPSKINYGIRITMLDSVTSVW